MVVYVIQIICIYIIIIGANIVGLVVYGKQFIYIFTSIALQYCQTLSCIWYTIYMYLHLIQGFYQTCRSCIWYTICMYLHPLIVHQRQKPSCIWYTIYMYLHRNCAVYVAYSVVYVIQFICIYIIHLILQCIPLLYMVYNLYVFTSYVS